jgi:hypothetical protein
MLLLPLLCWGCMLLLALLRISHMLLLLPLPCRLFIA